MATLYEHYNTGDNVEADFEGADWLAIAFTTGSVVHTVSSVKLKLWRFGSPGALVVSIRKGDATGAPIGADLASGSINANNLATVSPGAVTEIPITPLILQPLTKYVIVARDPAGNGVNYVEFRVDNTGGGSYYGSADSGVTWSGATPIGFWFEIWGDPLPSFGLYDSHDIVFTTEDGRVVSKSALTILTIAAGWIGVNVCLPDLKYIENVIHLQFTIRAVPADGASFRGPLNKKIVGNVVGMSIYSSTGATVTIDTVAVGPP